MFIETCAQQPTADIRKGSVTQYVYMTLEKIDLLC